MKLTKQPLWKTGGALALLAFLAACGSPAADPAPTTPAPPTANNQPAPTVPPVTDVNALGLDENMRFTDTRTISVALWDRANDRIPVFAESYWAEWVQAEILERHNINVEWTTVSRWNEEEQQTTMLGAGAAPDIGLTFSQQMVHTFGAMGGLHNLYPLLQQYGHLLPNLYGLVGEEMIYWELDPRSNELFAITGRLFQDGRTLKFIREDWLATLNLPVPYDLASFEYTLRAFRDNASILPGYGNGQMVPWLMDHDISWHGSLLFESLIPSNLTEREWFVHSFSGNNNERLMHFEDVMREGTRILNGWFHEGLLYQDFLVTQQQVMWDKVSLGTVGVFSGNWDFPFRVSEGIITGVQQNVGPDANFIAFLPFLNDAGEVRTFMPPATDRRIFMPLTNTEPLASLIYLDFMSSPEVLDKLQFGIEGRHHEVLPNGAIAMLSESADNPWPDNQVIPSLRNFDLALTVNGIHFAETDPDRAIATLALGYPGVSPEAIQQARNLNLQYGYWFRNANTRNITAEEGMTVPLLDARDVLLGTVIAGVTPAEFDAVFDSMFQNYMAMGGAAIIADREAAWVETFGDVDFMP